MLDAKEIRRIAEQARNSEANDFYFNKLEKRLAERIKKAAEEGRTGLTIGYADEINNDRWMDNADILIILQQELGKLGYQSKYNNDRDGEWLTITW